MGGLCGGKHCSLAVLERPLSALGQHQAVGSGISAASILLRWVLCDVQDSKSMSRGPRKRRCVGKIQGDVCLKQHEIQLEILSCRKAVCKVIPQWVV